MAAVRLAVAEEPALTDFLFLPLGPASGGNRFAREIDHRVGAIEGRGPRAARAVGRPGDMGHPRLWGH